MTDATPYTVPKEPGRWRAITLAALVHAALLIFLWIGIRWQNETPATIEAEVWSPQVREAAPPPPPPEPQPEPKSVAKETPKPIAPPAFRTTEPPIVKEPEKQPDIALEQEKKRKAREEQKRQERLEEERLAKQKQKAEDEREAKLKKLDDERVARQKKAEEEKLAKQKQKAEDEKLAKKKDEEQQRLAKDVAAKRAAAEKKRIQDEAETQVLAKVRDEEMRRITGGVTGTGGSGDAAKSQGGRADAGYAQRVGAKIKSNINYNAADDISGNPAVEYVVDLLPDGSVAGMRKTRSSGVSGFDEAVRRAIEKSQPFPKDKSGAVPSSFIGIHRPKDQ
jgi:colicin import membrane protein